MPLPPRLGKRRKQQNNSTPFQHRQKLDTGSPGTTFAALATAVECGSKDVDTYLQLSKLFSDKRQYMEALAIC